MTCECPALWSGGRYSQSGALVSQHKMSYDGPLFEPLMKPSAMSAPNQVYVLPSLQSFQAAIDNHAHMAIRFGAPWCGPCKTLGPIFQSCANEFPQVKFAQVNVEEVPEVAQAYRVRALPTIILFKQGRAQDTKTGLLSPDALRQSVQALVAE